MPRIRLFEIVGAAVLLALTAFAGISCVKTVSADRLGDATWVLKSYGEPSSLTAALPDKEVTLIFDKENKTVGGNNGVNLYGGKYEVDGNKLTIKELYQTMMAGPEPLMKQEAVYMKILNSAMSHHIEGPELTITGTEGTLVFTKK